MKFICWFYKTLLAWLKCTEQMVCLAKLIYYSKLTHVEVEPLGLMRRGHLFTGDDSVLSVLTSALCHWDSHQG